MRVPGYSQGALSALTVAVIGAGGLGGNFVLGAVRKGIGTLIIYDGDDVELSNLSRQPFSPRDVGRNKALSLARNASGAGYLGTRLVAVPFFFQAAVEQGLDQSCDLVLCGVDNDETRVYVARHYLDRPVVHVAVSDDAGHGHVIVQEPGKACFACFLPGAPSPHADGAALEDDGACPATPAVVDVVGAVAMVALYALDSLVMDRPRRWNFKQIVLHGSFPDITAEVTRNENCPVCGSKGPGADDPGRAL